MAIARPHARTAAIYIYIYIYYYFLLCMGAGLLLQILRKLD